MIFNNRRVPKRSDPKAKPQTLADITSMEFCRWAFMQEDLPEGAVTYWANKGWWPCQRVVEGDPLSPYNPTVVGTVTKEAGKAGVKFPGGGTNYIYWDRDTDATWANRWGVVIARMDMAASSVEFNHIGYVNGVSGGAAYSQPGIRFSPLNDTMSAFWQDGSVKEIALAASTSVSVWNVLVWYRRQGKFYVNVNGVWSSPLDFGAATMNLGGAGTDCYIGTHYTTTPADWWLDCWLMGQTEISDDVADKLVALAMKRAGRNADLISLGHRYAYENPRITEEDCGYRVLHNEAEWAAYRDPSGPGQGNVDVAPPNVLLGDRHAHRGEAEPDRSSGWTRVFYDDFTSNTVADNQTGGISNVWFAPAEIGPGNYTSAGNNSPEMRPSDTTAYNQSGSTLRLRTYYSGGWKSASLQSYNQCGIGRYWKGPMIRKVAFRYATSASQFPAGIFGAPIWSYDSLYSYWRTRNRIEYDDLELQGNSNTWFNTTFWGGHDAQAPGRFYSLTTRRHDNFEKYVGYNYTVSRGFPADANWFDNSATMHTKTTVFDTDGYVYGYLDGRETFREPIHPILRQNKFGLIVSHSGFTGFTPAYDTAHTYDMILDKVEVWYPTSTLSIVPVGFTARPTLSGTFTAGEVITCTPNITATRSNQVRYLWYRADGSPIAAATGPTYALTSAEVGQGIRVNVINCGYKDQPEAWTADSTSVSAPAEWTPTLENANHSLWYDFQDANNTLDGVRFSGVYDKSGNGRHANNATTGTTQPATANTSLIGGLRAGRADGGTTDCRMQITNPMTPPGNLGMLITTGNVDVTVFQFSRESNTHLSGTGFYTADAPTIASVTWGSIGWEMRRDGVVYASNSTPITTSNGSIWVVHAPNSVGGGNAGRVFDINTSGGSSYIFNRITGTGRGYDGDLGELIIRTTEANNSIREKYEGYLAHHWNLEGNLANTHPYKAAPPT